jgi:pimeloyl-ACP methyl ester carboxylesterase
MTITGALCDLDHAILEMKRNGIKEIAIAATSFGATIASLYSGCNSKEIKALAFTAPLLDFDTTFFHPTTELAKRLFAAVLGTLDSGAPYFEMPTTGYKIGKCVFSEMSLHDPVKSLASYDGPVLIVHSKDDDRIAYSDTVRCSKEIRNLKLVTISGAPHWIGEEPWISEVAEHLISFLKENL